MTLHHKAYSGLDGPRRIYGLEEPRKVGKSLDKAIKEYVNCITTL